MVRYSEAVRVVRHFLTQLIKMAKYLIYIGKGVKGECYRNCLTASLRHLCHPVPDTRRSTNKWLMPMRTNRGLKVNICSGMHEDEQ